MRKAIVTSLTVLALSFSSAGYTDASSAPIEETMEVEAASSPTLSETPASTQEASASQEAPPVEEPIPLAGQPKPVGAASAEAAKTAKRKNWQNIALAGAAVAVAIVAIILVDQNQGHRAHH